MDDEEESQSSQDSPSFDDLGDPGPADTGDSGDGGGSGDQAPGGGGLDSGEFGSAGGSDAAGIASDAIDAAESAGKGQGGAADFADLGGALGAPAGDPGVFGDLGPAPGAAPGPNPETTPGMQNGELEPGSRDLGQNPGFQPGAFDLNPGLVGAPTAGMAWGELAPGSQQAPSSLQGLGYTAGPAPAAAPAAAQPGQQQQGGGRGGFPDPASTVDPEAVQAAQQAINSYMDYVNANYSIMGFSTPGAMIASQGNGQGQGVGNGGWFDSTLSIARGEFSNPAFGTWEPGRGWTDNPTLAAVQAASRGGRANQDSRGSVGVAQTPNTPGSNTGSGRGANAGSASSPGAASGLNGGLGGAPSQVGGFGLPEFSPAPVEQVPGYGGKQAVKDKSGKTVGYI